MRTSENNSAFKYKVLCTASWKEPCKVLYTFKSPASEGSILKGGRVALADLWLELKEAHQLFHGLPTGLSIVVGSHEDRVALLAPDATPP